MSFINTSVDVTSLPAAEKIELKSIEPSYLKLLRLEWIIMTAVLLVLAALLIILIPAIRETKWWWIISLLWLFICAISRITLEKSFVFRKYAVRENDIIYQQGWIIRTFKICPFNRIQNCSVDNGPFERKFDLATLTIYTAGSGGADLRIPGLTIEDANTIKDFILNKIENEPPQL